MSQNSFEEVETLFDAVLALADEDRLAYLKFKASSDAVIADVMSLVEAHEGLGEFLTEPLQIDENYTPICPDLSNRRIGVWQVDHLIGQGGMGRVYLAHRADGEYEQVVAFKVVEFKQFDNSAFLKERQILALLDHPNIVSLFDAGTLEEGFPYLVMEFIDGAPIDNYRKKHHKLSERELLVLFLRLCRIVQSAHGHGIIHCDLKPSNIYISDKGILKLLDFGIAQSLLSIPPKTKVHDTPKFSFTPEYSSPNRHLQQYPTVQDDIYSLGILFAQLLTNKKPTLKLHSSGYEQPDTNAIAKQIDNLELQSIFFSAVGETSKSKRYTSTPEFIEDLGRYLDKLPLKAMGKDLLYVSKKNLQRNWVQWTSAATLLALVIVGGISTWQVQKAHQESQFIRQMSENLLQNMDESLEQLPETTPTRKLLISSVVDQLETFQEQSPDDIEVTKMLADTYAKLGVVAGSPYVLSLGEVTESKGYYQKSLELYQSVLNKRTDKLQAYKEISKVKRELAKLYAEQGDYKNMQTVYLEMRTEMEQVYRHHPLSKQHPLAVTYIVGAHGEMHLGNLDESSRLLDGANKILQALEGNEKNVKYEIEKRFVEEETANILLLQEKYKEASEIYTSLLGAKPMFQHWRITRANARINMALGCIALKNKQSSEALNYFSAAHSIYKSLSLKYPSVRLLKKSLEKYSSFDSKAQRLSLEEMSQQMGCNMPRSFMMPLNNR